MVEWSDYPNNMGYYRNLHSNGDRFAWLRGYIVAGYNYCGEFNTDHHRANSCMQWRQCASYHHEYLCPLPLVEWKKLRNRYRLARNLYSYRYRFFGLYRHGYHYRWRISKSNSYNYRHQPLLRQ